MKDNITIVHLSDLHANKKDQYEIEQRVKQIFQDVENECENVHAFLVTGDIAFSGTIEEYNLAVDLLFNRIIKRFHIQKNRIMIVPGNHDINRQLIDRYTEKGLITDLTESKKASDYVFQNTLSLERMKAYYSFLQSYFNQEQKVYQTHILSENGINLGFACLNSSWRCSSDDDKGKLFVSDRQVNAAFQELNDCVLTIALLHHPLSYLHDSEMSYTAKDLKRNFDLILSGHIHESDSVLEQSPDTRCVLQASPAINSHYPNIGYNIYEIDFDRRKLLVKYRQFSRARNKFVPNVNIADDGKSQYDLPTRNMALIAKASVCQRITTVNSKIDQSIKQQLRRYQELDNPILITPYIKKVTWNDNRMIEDVFRGEILEISQTNCVVSGPQQCGKTIFLQTLASAYNSEALKNRIANYAIYIDLEKKEYDQDKLLELIENKIEEVSIQSEFCELLLCFDHLIESDDNLCLILQKIGFANSKFKIVFAISNDLLFDSLGTNAAFSKFDFYRISYWGPSRIHEFTKQFSIDKNLDHTLAYSFLVNSLKDSDLQASPVTVTLYLFAFLIQGSELTSLSFLQVLQKIEEHRLGTADVTPQRSLYFKRQILMRLAMICREQNCLFLDRVEVERLTLSYFDSKGFTFDVVKYLEELDNSGILYLSDSKVEFKQYVFFDYYLAMAMKEGLLDPNEVISTPASYVNSSEAIALFCGMNREFSDAPRKLFEYLSSGIIDEQQITLHDLDNYISDLLMPIDVKKSSSEEVTKALTKKVNYEILDKDFEEKQSKYKEGRQYSRYLENPTNSMEKVFDKLQILKSFYNSFRNLEALDLTLKEEYLNRILEYHIDCNMVLIKFFSDLLEDSNMQTVIGYLMTLGGQRLLSTNIANQSLSKPILNCIETTDNDFKKLLLVTLYADLHLPRYTEHLKTFAEQTKSKAGIEIIYLKIHALLVMHESENIPVQLIEAFEIAFKKRQEIFRSKMSKGALQNMLHRELTEAKLKHRLQRQSDKRLREN